MIAKPGTAMVPLKKGVISNASGIIVSIALSGGIRGGRGHPSSHLVQSLRGIFATEATTARRNRLPVAIEAGLKKPPSVEGY